METQKFVISLFDSYDKKTVFVTPPMPKDLTEKNYKNLLNDLNKGRYSNWTEPKIVALPEGCPEKLSDLKPGQKVKHTKENEIRILEITDVLCDDDYFGYAEIIDSEGERNRIYPTDLADIQIIEE